MIIPAATIDRPVWLRVGTLIDGSSIAPLRDAHVVYNDRQILYIGSDGRMPPRYFLRPGQQNPDVDATDATLLPGLIEAHAHLFLEGGELDPATRAAYLQRPPEQLLAGARNRLALLLRLGVVAVRDAGDKEGVGLALSRARANERRSLVPYVDSPGAAINRLGRYGGFMSEPAEAHSSLRECVAARVAAGADRIKLIPTGIINFRKGTVTTEPQMTTAEVGEIVAAAKSFGRQTFAHASGDSGIDRAIDGGVDSIEHGYFLRDDQLAKLRDRQTAWVPTFAPVQAQIDHADRMGWDQEVVANLRRILDQHAASLAKARDLGVLIVAGSDAGSYGVAHGTGLLDELEWMERAGLPPLAVINAATGTPAARFAFQEKFGRIIAGFASRFILTRYSPLETVANLRRARHVIFDGDVFSSNGRAATAGL